MPEEKPGNFKEIRKKGLKKGFLIFLVGIALAVLSGTLLADFLEKENFQETVKGAAEKCAGAKNPFRCCLRECPEENNFRECVTACEAEIEP